MTFSLLLTYCLTVPPSGNPTQPQLDLGQLQMKLSLGKDVFEHGSHQQKAHREGMMQMIKSLQDQMDQVEKLMAHSPDIFSPADLRATRKQHDKDRHFYAKMLAELQEAERQEKWRDALKYWAKQQQIKPGLAAKWEAVQSLNKLHEELWGKKSNKVVAPPPREKK